MRITIEELSAYGVSENLPPAFKSLKAGEYYCFYYVMDYDNSKIRIIKDFIAIQLNTSLYRDIFSVIQAAGTADLFLGYFTNTIETRDGLFYLFLNTYAPSQNVQDFYAAASQSDTANELRVSNSASIDIRSRESFAEALAFFCHPDKINTILSVYDIVNDYSQFKHKTSLYGGVIKRVVQLVTHDCGVVSEENGSLRFMVIGENANLSQEQKERLNTAKSLLRSLVNPKDIYIQTGWSFDVNDGYWRTNISDVGSSINNQLVVKINDNLSIYKPNFCPVTQEQIVTNINNPVLLLNQGYNGRLSDILEHDTLYRYYPELASLPLVFAYNKSNTFYYSHSSERFQFINITGDEKNHNILSILLHETQHAIQRIENFATGGNSDFANFVIALGGKQVRSIFASIFNFQKFVSTQVNTEELYLEFRSAIEQISANSPSSRQYKSIILNDLMPTYSSFLQNTNSAAFYLIYLITDTKVFNEGAIISFLETYYGDEVYDMFEKIKDSIDGANRASEKLLSEGFTREDVRIINFNTYQNLLGEMEARGTQHQMRIPLNLTNYFFLSEYEKSPTKSIAVIGGQYIERDVSKIFGACEKGSDGRYILHFKKNISAEPFLHELGHIVHDILKEIGFGQILKNEYDKEILSDDYDEFFVNVFLGYLADNYKDTYIGQDLIMNFSIKKNEVIYQILDDIFNPIPQDLEIIQKVLKELE